MSYIPDDPVADSLIDVWLHTKRKCARCCVEYFAIDNIGSWRCKQFIFDHVANCYTSIRADHSHIPHVTYGDIHDVVIQASMFAYMRGRFHPDAVVGEVVHAKKPDGTISPYPAIRIRRYDRAAWVDIVFQRDHTGPLYRAT
jgi:hypothetical protein